MIPQGGDFQYTNAHMNFDSSDRLIESFNAKFQNVTLMYSTPSEYVNALNEVKTEWPVNEHDMFPYADKEDTFWSGYFSSRALSKRAIREGS